MALRIGMILDNDFPPDSRVENEAISLIEAGYEVFLFSLSYKKWPRNEEISGIKIKRYPFGKLTHKLSALAYSFPLYHAIIRGSIKDFLIKNDIQVLHVHDMLIARAVWQIKPQQIPLVLDLHENRPAIMKSYRHVNTLQGRLLIYPGVWRKYQDRYIQKADKVVVVTDHAKNEIVKEGLKNYNDIVTVPNTIHPEIFRKYEMDKSIVDKFRNTFNVLYLGDTGLRRGTDTAIQASSILSQLIPDFRLILVGSNKEDVILKKMVKELKLEKNVIFEGWQDVSKFPSYINACHVGISPLKRNRHHDTTYANKVFQYMSWGKPIVVSDCPPQSEVVINYNAGLVHAANNPEDLADKIHNLYSNKAQREEMGVNAKDAVNTKWNWLKTSKDLIKMYQGFESTLITQ